MAEFHPTEGMAEALIAVKEAVSSKELVAYLTHYYIHESTVTATDGRMVACGPFPDPREYLVPADDFERVLRIVGPKGKVSIKEGAIWMSSKKRRAKIRTLDPKDFAHLKPDGDQVTCPKDLVTALRRVRPFVSDDATKAWAMAVSLKDNAVYATNNVLLATSPLKAKISDMMIPVWAVDYLLDRDVHPSKISLTESQAAFYYADGSWMRTVLVAGAAPENLFALAAGVDVKAGGVKITDDWREAFEAVAELSEDEVRIYPDKLTGGRAHAEIEIETVSGITDEASFNPKYMATVLERATAWDLTNYPDPAHWWGDNIRGLMVGRRT